MPDVTKKNVLDTLKALGEPVSATALSKELQFSKKNATVCGFLDELVREGLVEENNDGNFVKYAVVKGKKASKEKEEKPATEEKKKANAVAQEALPGFDPSSVKRPVNDHGYTIEENTRGFKVVFPNGSEHQITKTQRVLVINGEKKLLVYQPEDVLFAIDDFCRKKQIQNYLIKDLSVGRAVAPREINMNPCIIFVQVERHNKAGF